MVFLKPSTYNHKPSIDSALQEVIGNIREEMPARMPEFDPGGHYRTKEHGIMSLGNGKPDYKRPEVRVYMPPTTPYGKPDNQRHIVYNGRRI